MTAGLARISSGRPSASSSPVVEDRDPFADSHDHLHVVLDEQDREIQLVAEMLDELGHLGRLAGVHAGGGLVQQQQLRLARQRARQLEPALVAVRQVLGPVLLVAPRQADELEELLRLALRLLLLGAHGGKPQEGAPPARLHADVAADHHVGQDRHGAEEADVLERPADPDLDDLVRRASDERLALERDLARGRLEHAGELVEERRLAGPVRADERHDGAPRDGEVHVAVRDQAAEPHRDLVGLEDGIGDLHRARRGRRRGRHDVTTGRPVCSPTSSAYISSSSSSETSWSSARRARLGRSPSGRRSIMTTSTTP